MCDVIVIAYGFLSVIWGFSFYYGILYFCLTENKW